MSRGKGDRVTRGPVFGFGEVEGLFGRGFADVRGTDSASRPCILVINSCLP